MLGSTVLEVAVGLTFCYATVALIVSTVQETLASLLRLRARTLLDGIKTMLNDPDFNALARALYSHALVNPHGGGNAASQRDLKAKPSYIEPNDFASALLDSIQSVRGNFEQLGRDIDGLANPHVRRALQAIYQQAAGDIDKFKAALADWFDNAMERVSGAYKRRSTMVSLGLTLLLAILFNIDSIHLFRTLWQHPALVGQLGIDGMGRDAVSALSTLPIGWQSFPTAFDAAFAMQVAGWLLTAATGLFGAPFWFDLLQHAMRIRGTGEKPVQRSREGSAHGAVGVDQKT
jgi:hypothetical protein